MIFTIFRIWRREAMHVAYDRQLLAISIALLLSAEAGVRGDDAAAQGSAQQELRAAKLVEATIFAEDTQGARARMRRIYAQLETRYPADAAIKVAHGEFLWNINDRLEAMGKWQAAARIEPANGAVFNHLGGAHLAIGEVRLAYDHFSRAVQNDPTNASYRINLANVAFMFRHELSISKERAFEVARREFAEASRLAPSNAEYAQAHAEFFYALPEPDWESALRAWRHFHEVTKDKEFGLINLSRIHLKLGDDASALACFSRLQTPRFDRVKAKILEQIHTWQMSRSSGQKMP